MATIIGLGGKLSGGKTVTAVSLLKDDADKGKRIISNIPIFNIPNVRYLSSEDLIDLIINNRTNQSLIEKIFLNSSILIDEARGLYSSRRSMSNLAEITTSFIMMLGKLDVNFYYTFQVFTSQIDIQLREITQYIFDCKRIDKTGKDYFGPRKAAETIYINVKIYEVIPNGLRYTGKSFTYDPTEFYKYYNTREFVIVNREKYLKK